MAIESIRTPDRVLILGCTAFARIDSVNWGGQVPNFADYDLVIVSVPHITEDFLRSVDSDYLERVRKGFIQLLHSGGKIVALVSAKFDVSIPSIYPYNVSNIDWCPVEYTTIQESGESIVFKQNMYEIYLKGMSEWSFHLAIPNGYLTKELVRFYGDPSDTSYKVSLEPYLENRYGGALAGHLHIEIKKKDSDSWGNRQREHSVAPGIVLGDVVLLPLVGRLSPEEALAKILQEEIGFTLESPEPDWVQSIEMPGVPELLGQVDETKSRIKHETDIVQELEMKIADIHSYRRLLYGTGTELEEIVKKSLEKIGAVVSPSRYSQEEYILEFENQEFPMEVKGVTKSITLGHLRQLNDYLLKYEEDTGKEGKGILFGNTWRNHPPEMRGKEGIQEFPDNVVKRAEQWGISLVPSTAFFSAFVRALKNPGLSKDLLVKITTSNGIVSF